MKKELRIATWYKNTKLKKLIDFIVKVCKINGFFYMPPSLAFYLIISCIPLISIIFMVLSFYSRGSAENIIVFLEVFNTFSDGTIDNILKYLQEIQTTDYVTLIVTTVASIYVASRAIECFSRFSDRFYGREKLNKQFFRRKVRSIIITFIFVIFVSMAISIPTIVTPLLKSLTNGITSYIVQYISLLLVLFAAFMFVFKAAPTEKQRLVDLIPGVLFCTIGSTLSIFGYSIYLNFAISQLSSIYGPLTSIIILLFLALLISYIMIIGFYLNILINEYTEKKEKARQNEIKKAQVRLVHFSKKEEVAKKSESSKAAIVIIKDASSRRKD